MGLGSIIWGPFLLGGLLLGYCAHRAHRAGLGGGRLAVGGASSMLLALASIAAPGALPAPFWLLAVSAMGAFGLWLVVRSFGLPPEAPIGTGLRFAGCLVSVPLLAGLALLALGLMFGLHGRGYFNDPAHGTRNMALTAGFIVSAAALLAGIAGLYRSLGMVDRNRIKIEDPAELALAQKSQRRRQLLWAAAALAGAVSIYLLLSAPSPPRKRPGVIDCSAPGPVHPLC